MSSPPWMTSLLAKYQALRGRERTLIAVTLVAALGFLADAAFLRRLEASRDASLARIQSIHGEIAAEEAKQRATIATASADPNAQLIQDRDRLRSELGVLNGQLQQKVAGLVPPSEIVHVLRSLLDAQHGMKLKRLESLPPTPVAMGEESAATTAEEAALFEHGVRLELEGGFADAWAYLQRIESLPSGLVWDRISFDVDTYPNANLTLEVHTLSESDRWIGV